MCERRSRCATRGRRRQAQIAADLDSAWEQVGDSTTAAFRRVVSYAEAHCELGQVK